MSGWGTPRAAAITSATMEDWIARNARCVAKHGRGMGKPLELEVTLAGWPTTQASDGSGGGQMKRALNPARSNDLMDFAMLAGWPTATARDGFPAHSEEYIAAKKAQGHGMANLNDLVMLAANPQPARFTVSGEMLTGCSAGMESGGQLRPAHSRWLMGYPVEWDECAIRALKKRKGR